MKKYVVRESNTGIKMIEVWQGDTWVVAINPKLDNPRGVAEGICKVLNEQNKYILPTKNYGGGYIRKLTKKEKERQKAIMEHRLTLENE